ncbi:hypothetical protein IWZ03DRAFT_358800 [Phyllosticta citriasiana]|uniref:Secreted protein n=1 Tax=Phyllosticta citriasiana TaxID=595635 RepID=A0ABR1KNI9_9PEZI
MSRVAVVVVVVVVVVSLLVLSPTIFRPCRRRTKLAAESDWTQLMTLYECIHWAMGEYLAKPGPCGSTIATARRPHHRERKRRALRPIRTPGIEASSLRQACPGVGGREPSTPFIHGSMFSNGTSCGVFPRI